MNPLRHKLLSAGYWLLIGYLILPLVLMAVMALKDGAFIGMPIKKWTLHWFTDAINDGELRQAFVYSLWVAVLSTALAVGVGVWTALVMQRLNGWKHAALFGLGMLPLVVPSIISAISLRIFTQGIGLQPGTLALVLGLAIQGVPFVLMTVTLRLASLPQSQLEAARDLGCNPLTAFFRVTLPWIMPAIMAAALFAMLSGFDDFVRAIFLTGYEKTLPVLLYAKLTSGLSPLIPAIATLIVLFSLVLGLIGDRANRRLQRRS